MSTKELFGWDLLYHVIKNDIQRKEDVLVAFIHWYLIKQGFRCLGAGENRTITPSDVPSELLPRGWSGQEKTALRYIRDNELYIMHGMYNEGSAFFNLLNVESLVVSNAAFIVNDTVGSVHGALPELIPKHNEVINIIKLSLIDPVFAGTSREAETQTPQPSSNARPDLADPLVRPRSPPGRSLNIDLLRDINEAGRRDLNPAGIGGRIGPPGHFNPDGTFGHYDPFHPGFRGRGGSQPGLGVPGGVARGSIIPGARFDPFGPPNPDQVRPGRRAPPDSDHLPPPGFGYDDMFS